MEDSALIEAARRGDQLAFELLLRRYQPLLNARASSFYLPDGDSDDIDQEARVGFMKAVRCYRGGRGSSFRTFAELCVSRQLAGAIAAARRAKHQPLNESARGDQADRRLAAVPDREDPLDQLVTRDRLDDLVRQAGRLSELERSTLAHALAGWSTGEAARRLALPRRSTDNALQRARAAGPTWGLAPRRVRAPEARGSRGPALLPAAAPARREAPRAPLPCVGGRSSASERTPVSSSSPSGFPAGLGKSRGRPATAAPRRRVAARSSASSALAGRL
jgi:RNA polymerase sporulation-specific sigma factor